jgi:Mn2+/Fe2+ NRAMP family transporter
MGGLVNMKITTAFATLASIVIVALNILLLVITFRGGV